MTTRQKAEDVLRFLRDGGPDGYSEVTPEILAMVLAYGRTIVSHGKVRLICHEEKTPGIVHKVWTVKT